MSDDLRKQFWIGVAVVAITVMITFIIAPTISKVKAQQTSINTVDYTDK